MSETRQPSEEAKLVWHGSLLMVGTLVGAVFSAAFHMLMGREQVLPNAEYGSLVAMLGIILVASTPMMALQNTLAHYISTRARAGRNDHTLPYFLHWVRLFLVISAVLVLGAWLFCVPLAGFWGVPPLLIGVTGTVLAATLWMSLFQGLLQGTQEFVLLAWIPQAWGVGRLVLGTLLVLTFSATAATALVGQGLGVLTVILLGIWALWRLKLPKGEPPARSTDSYQYLGSAFFCLAGYAMLMNLDVTLAKRFFEGETVGLFAKAATIARTAVFLPIPIATALFPKVSSTGDLSAESWRLLRRALGFAALLIGAVVAACLLLPGIPWAILYGRWTPEIAAEAARMTRAMVLAQAPLAMAYLLLNFEMAQRHFRSGFLLVPAAGLYIAGIACFHTHPLQIPAILGFFNLLALMWLFSAVWRRKHG